MGLNNLYGSHTDFLIDNEHVSKSLLFTIDHFFSTKCRSDVKASDDGETLL